MFPQCGLAETPFLPDLRGGAGLLAGFALLLAVGLLALAALRVALRRGFAGAFAVVLVGGTAKAIAFRSSMLVSASEVAFCVLENVPFMVEDIWFI